MKNPDNPDWLALERLYQEGRQLFLRGQYEDAIGCFKRIYENTLHLRDVAQIVDDYHTMPFKEWVAKYQLRFQKPDPE